eukprot:TRINITY_DN5549_c0_g1_i2.p1 TRINITY_DN5549_c0_g1~~TRINITY_DN5549_c0_g1_i2.p1  ORF type:complete len:135 (-),score=27.13 TRINITY_DN5549_c0_g1_i2:25-429(-)
MTTTHVPSGSSTTVVTHQTPEFEPPVPETRILTLKLQKPKHEKKVQWTEDVVDNEGMGKKKSKKCCIFHKKRRYDESSTESDSSDSGECEHHDQKHHDKDPSHKHDHDSSGHDTGLPDKCDHDTGQEPEKKNEI